MLGDMDYFQERNARLLMLLDFSRIPRAPHECKYELWERHAPIFYGDDPIEFISEFLEFIAWHNIFHEDVMMTMFP